MKPESLQQSLTLMALLGCIQMQECMMQKGTGWSADVLALPGCRPEMTAGGRLIWYGPRVKMGMYEGVPTNIMPHATSGRADYFGPLVNRHASIIPLHNAAAWSHSHPLHEAGTMHTLHSQGHLLLPDWSTLMLPQTAWTCYCWQVHLREHGHAGAALHSAPALLHLHSLMAEKASAPSLLGIGPRLRYLFV